MGTRQWLNVACDARSGTLRNRAHKFHGLSQSRLWCKIGELYARVIRVNWFSRHVVQKIVPDSVGDSFQVIFKALDPTHEVMLAPTLQVLVKLGPPMRAHCRDRFLRDHVEKLIERDIRG